jgi:hypothetical protein
VVIFTLPWRKNPQYLFITRLGRPQSQSEFTSNMANIYSIGIRFKSWSEHWLSCLKCLWFYLVPPNKFKDEESCLSHLCLPTITIVTSYQILNDLSNLYSVFKYSKNKNMFLLQNCVKLKHVVCTVNFSY